MTTESFDRRLTTWLETDARGRVPDHLTEVLVRTRATRQRPAWSSLERWLPVDRASSTAPLGISRIGRLALVGLLLLVIAALAILATGSRTDQSVVVVPSGSTAGPSLADGSARPTQGPGQSPGGLQPFGPARNGVVVFGSAGQIDSFDPATEQLTTIVGSADDDRNPIVSRDGKSIVFDRVLPDARHQLMFVGVDGRGLRALGTPMNGFDNVAWSPDGTRIAMDSDVDGVVAIRVVDLDGTVSVVLPHTSASVISIVNEVQWHPGGNLLIFRGWKPETSYFGIWTVRVDGTNLRQVLSGTDREPSAIALSPDGSTVAFAFFDEGRIRLVDSVTGDALPVTFEGSVGGDFLPTWSPDGSRLAFQRTAGGTSHVVIGQATGGPVVEAGPAFGDSERPAVAFSPDGANLIAWYPGDETWLLDVVGGPGEQLPFTATQLGSWQRLAP